MMNRRLLHEWWLYHTTVIKLKPELVKIPGRDLMAKFVEKYGEGALAKLIELNGTADVHTVFCSDCGHRINEKDERIGVLVRGRPLCLKHQCEPCQPNNLYK